MTKIIIVGDGARGKTTFAKNLSEKLKIPKYSTDDFYWEVKYSKKADINSARKKITKLFKEDSWIVEGATKKLIEPGLDKADVILWFRHKSLTKQIFVHFKRHLKRRDETFFEFLALCKHFFYRRFRLSYEKHRVQYDEFLESYKDKVVELKSFKEINKYLENN